MVDHSFDRALAQSGFWVFGYGSLMWNPGFPHTDARTGRVYGYHRRLCLWSTRYRGSEEKPGLIVGLAPGGSCIGMSFRVEPGDAERTLDYLHEREMLNNVYRPTLLTCHMEGGLRAPALTFVSRTDHPQYAPPMPLEQQVGIVAGAAGPRGTNLEYILNTARHLEELNIHDRELSAVVQALETPRAGGATPSSIQNQVTNHE